MNQNNHHFHDLSGERKDQLLITCDKKGKLSGTASREDCHAGKGKTHLAFMAFLVDKNNNLILTKRSSRKSLWGGYWDAPNVSHVLSGETVEEAAHRRGKEELAVEADFKVIGAFYYFANQGKVSENEYCYVLMGKTNIDITPNPVEIDDVKTISLAEFLKQIKENPADFTPWFQKAVKKVTLHIT